MTIALDSSNDGAAVDRFLRALDTRMRREIARTPAAHPARPYLDAGGKRLRARLLWWSALATTTSDRPPPPEDGELVRAAAAVELAHLASLIHDDIVDGAQSRRGVSSLHRAHGVRIATDAGVALVHVASALAAGLGSPARRAVRRALLAICRGQVRELAAPFVAVSLRARWAIMQEKTAAFFELAAALGTRLGGATPFHRAAVLRFARRWAVAFQIADDVLDLAGDPGELGRDNGADLRDGVLTVPVLLTADGDGALAQALCRLRRSPDAARVAACAALVERGGGITNAAALASWWLERATTSLALLPATPARRALLDLAHTSVRRGLTRGLPRFVATSPSRPRVALGCGDAAPDTTSLTALSRAPDAAARLAHALDWMQPGLSRIAAAQAREVATAAERFERLLLRSDVESPGARLAARAIALAHALGQDRSLQTDPVRTLALADCLHCVGVALLCDGADAVEHARLAFRAQSLPSPTRSDIARSPGPRSEPLPPLALDR